MPEMIRCKSLLFLSILLVVGCSQAPRRGTLAVTYIANEGFMIAMGDTKVLIDALPKSPYYRDPSDSLVAKLMDDIAPFDKVDYVLVTHDHPDHFNADMMSRFLQRHPAVHFVAGGGACGKISVEELSSRRYAAVDIKPGQHETVNSDKAEVVALPLVHSGNPDFPNLAYIVRSNGRTIVHVGDARLAYNEEFLRAVDWSSYTVDLLFLQYFDRSSETRQIIENLIKPKYVVLMHIPPGAEEEVRNEREQIHPRTVVFRNEGETEGFDALF